MQLKKKNLKEKIFANHVSNKEFKSRIYKEHLQLNNTKRQILKWTKDLNTHFSKDIKNDQQSHQSAQRH